MNPPKLSELSEQDKLRLAAELDGVSEGSWVEYASTEQPYAGRMWSNAGWNKDGVTIPKLPGYSTSYDAIIPLIQKQSPEIRAEMFEKTAGRVSIRMTPPQLLDALLVATGKAMI